MKELDEIRGNTNQIDDQLLDLLNQRAALALNVKETSDGNTPIRPEREAEIIRRLNQANDGPLPNIAVRSIFIQIIASFRDQMQLSRQVTVSYLGPKGTFSEEAAISLYGTTVKHYPEATITSVMRTIESGVADLAVVPIENSTEGSVTETHQQLLKTNASIVSEITMPINHCLLSKEKDLNRIKCIYAHPQALGQCREWLMDHLPKAELTASSSNAMAGGQAARHAHSAAIASKRVGEVYKLKVIQTGINDQPDNQTRFVALGKLKTKPTSNDKTSIICVMQDKAGALCELLKLFALNNISMTRLTSQPYREGQYVFYIDFNGHKDDPGVKAMFDKMIKQTVLWKVLGSYPKGETSL